MQGVLARWVGLHARQTCLSGEEATARAGGGEREAAGAAQGTAPVKELRQQLPGDTACSWRRAEATEGRATQGLLGQ